MLRIISISIAILLASISLVNAQLKIGYMNPQEALNQLPGRDTVESQLDAFVQQKRTELQNKTAEFQQQLSQFEQNSSSMSDEQRQKEEARLNQLNQELEEFQLSIQNQVQQKRAELLEPLLARVDQAIAEVSKEMGLDFVLNEATSNNDRIIFFADNNAPNITQKVIDKLNQN